MSKDTSYLLQGLVVKNTDTLQEKFKEFTYDWDLDGTNGEEYTDPKTIKAGFECDRDYILYRAEERLKKKKFKTFFKKVQKYCDDIISALPDCYDESDMVVTEVDENTVVVSFMNMVTT